VTEPTLSVDRLTPAIGALIEGVDLRGECSATLLNRLYALLIEHLVLFFPDQSLTPEMLLVFAETFGELDTPHHVYPHLPGYERIVLLENDGDRRPNTDVWHTDLTFKQNPPFASILYAKAIPASGGDTLWCSMYAAYEALSDGMKADLCDLSAGVVYLLAADKYPRLTRRLSQEQKGLDERARTASQRPSPSCGRPRRRPCGRTAPTQATSPCRFPPPPLAHTPAGCGHGGTRYSKTSLSVHTWSVNPAAIAGV
jgi:alpha-ketoglutarate-dependent taurine dioxygenase